MNTINTIAPCGMNCALCYAFQDRKKPCSGCRSKMAEVRKNCRNCLILSCDKKEYYCFECSIFPCRRLKSLDARYRIKYGMSMLENLIFISFYTVGLSGMPGQRNFLRGLNPDILWKTLI